MAVSFAVFSSCNGDDDESEVVILVDYDGPNIVSPEQILLFDINSFSNDDIVESIKILSSDKVNGQITLLDTMVNKSSFEYTYQYKVPVFSDTTDLKLTFRAYSSNGIHSQTTKRLSIIGSSSVLEPLDGITMFSACSNDRNGFSIEKKQTVYCSSEDSLYIDIYDMPSLDSISLSRQWQSRTGLLFSKFNDFSFETATKQNVENAYDGAVKYTEIQNINDNDIILIGRTKAVGVIKVLAVIDDEGCANDRYILMMKLIQ